ncbi:hypothetical protein QJS10_CPB14g00976 [Acorus calamus]|uniref:Reverse transcriptase domain-containing protein n=1 Tax=Acorus calamus TaxID=4465 RepID=A0AAV9DBZ0_ACOCL|nr:hypothetical protein QJS10_CPB14g00976 [Acorus calamus]
MAGRSAFEVKERVEVVPVSEGGAPPVVRRGSVSILPSLSAPVLAGQICGEPSRDARAVVEKEKMLASRVGGGHVEVSCREVQGGVALDGLQVANGEGGYQVGLNRVRGGVNVGWVPFIGPFFHGLPRDPDRSSSIGQSDPDLEPERVSGGSWPYFMQEDGRTTWRWSPYPMHVRGGPDRETCYSSMGEGGLEDEGEEHGVTRSLADVPIIKPNRLQSIVVGSLNHVTSSMVPASAVERWLLVQSPSGRESSYRDRGVSEASPGSPPSRLREEEVTGVGSRKWGAIREHIVGQKVSICCIQETKKQEVSLADVRAISGGSMTEFVFKPSRGASGGVLLCWDGRHRVLEHSRVGEFSLSVMFADRVTSWRWVCSVVYGPNDDALRPRLWGELSAVRADCSLPWCVLGDFNVTRFVEDRNRQGSISPAMASFSDWIAQEGLIDIPLANQGFTWSSLRDAPALAKLDRVLVDRTWEEAHPTCDLKGLPRVLSDHSPLLLCGGSRVRQSPIFRFENWWLMSPGFKGRVEASWGATAGVLTGAQKVAYKLKRLKMVLKHWNRAELRARRERKVVLADQIYTYEQWEEARLISEEDRITWAALKQEWSNVSSLEEVAWRQRSREIWLKEGDSNTNFFHAAANGRRRINKITQLNVEGRRVENRQEIEQRLVEHFMNAFKSRRGWSPVWIDEDLGRIPDHLLQPLEADFNEEEVKAAIFGTEADKAPGPDGFGLRFFQEFWGIVKDDLMEMFHNFFVSSNGIGGLNATFLVLIPKQEGAVEIGDFRPISLVNGCYKMLSKVLANRLKKVINFLVDKNQSAFIPGRLLQDGYLTVQECISASHREKKKGVVIKLDFAKAYDNVNWEFLFHLLSCHGFEPNWVRMLRACITTAKASVMVNGEPCGFFNINKGLRQGDPLSPLLFVIVSNVFNRMMKRAMESGWVKGLSSREGGSIISHVQYADDTFVLSKARIDAVRGVKFVCRCFELVLGLQVNFQKSSITGIHVDNNFMARLAHILSCEVKQFPLLHLGLPLHVARMGKCEWAPLVSRFERRLEGWKSSFLSLGGRLTLIQAVLTNLPIYYLSIFKIPKGVLARLECIRRRFLWSGVKEMRRKIPLVKWEVVCTSKKQGGTGVLNLEAMNSALLMKWLWRWISNPELLWCKVVRECYGCGALARGRFPRVTRKMSWLWKGILAEVETFSQGIFWRLGSGEDIRFWQDHWIGDKPLKVRFPSIFHIARLKQGAVCLFWQDRGEDGSWSVKFTRALNEVEGEVFLELMEVLQPHGVESGRRDEAVWRTSRATSFTVKKGYEWLRRDQPILDITADKRREVWGSKAPPKVKIFMWIM